MAFEKLKNFFNKDQVAELDEAKLTDPKFIEFMQRVYGDVGELDPSNASDAETLAKRMGGFEKEDKVVKELSKVYAKQLTGLTKVDNAEVILRIREHIESELRNDPSSLDTLSEKLEAFAESEKILAEQKKELEKYKNHGGVEGLREKYDIMKKAEKPGSWWKKSADGESAAKRLKEEYKLSLDKLDEEMARTSELLASAEVADEQIGMMKRELVEIRTELLAGMELAQSLAELGRETLKTKMQEVQDTLYDKTVPELKKIYSEMAQIRDVKDGRNMVFSNQEEFIEEYDQFLEQLEQRMFTQVMLDFKEAVDNTDFGDMEKKLVPLLKAEGLPGNSKADVRGQLRYTMEQEAENDANAPEKRFMLKALLMKYKFLEA